MKVHPCRCGSIPEFVKLYSNRDGGFFRCRKCGYEGRYYTSKQNAVKYWNKEMNPR